MCPVQQYAVFRLQSPAFFDLLSMSEHSCGYEEMTFHSDSKTDVKVRCEYRIQFHLFDGA
jgi:hypothetical protein